MTDRDAKEAHRLAAEVARRSYGKLVAFLAARTRDVAAAEDALSAAFITALADWTRNGCPNNPEAWLLTTARRKWIDEGRHRVRGKGVANELLILGEGLQAAETGQGFPDHRLALMFACAHPAIDVSIRAPLILQTVLGLNAGAIASAFLTSPTTMGQRLVRAKSKIRQTGIPFKIPEREEWTERLGAVLDAIYAAFAEGWSDPLGTDIARRDWADETLFLGRLCAELLPGEPEVLGLLALMLHAEARRAARRTDDGTYVPLAAQNPALWNMPMIMEAEGLLIQACASGCIGRYQLEAAIQSAHVHRQRTGVANWSAIVQLYDALLILSGSPVVAINRALAIQACEGAAAALIALQTVDADPRVQDYQPYWAARAELLAQVGDRDAAHQAYTIAIGLERDPAVRSFLLHRQRALPS